MLYRSLKRQNDEERRRTLLLIDRHCDHQVLMDAHEHAVATIEFSEAKVTSINMNGGNAATSELRYEFWRLLVDHVLCHPTFGYVCLPEPNPIRSRLSAMGISDSFIDALHCRLGSNGNAKLALLVWSIRPSRWQRLTTHCDLRFFPG